MQSSYGCYLNTVAWAVELTYLHVAVKCESLLGGHGRARCTVIQYRHMSADAANLKRPLKKLSAYFNFYSLATQ